VSFPLSKLTVNGWNDQFGHLSKPYGPSVKKIKPKGKKEKEKEE
jgi:hypothetical protein